MSYPGDQFRFSLVVIVSFFFVFCSAHEANIDLEDVLSSSTKNDKKVLGNGGRVEMHGTNQMMYNMGLRRDINSLAPGRRLQNRKGRQSCITIASQGDLETAITTAASTPAPAGKAQVVNVCPGLVTMSGAPIDLNLPNPVALQCSKPKACVITPASGYNKGFLGLRSGTLSVEGMIVSNFQDTVFMATGSGGTTLTLKKSEFNNNEARINPSGGVVDADSITLIIVSCTFRGNFAQGYGGAIAQQGQGTLEISDSHFESNKAGVYGGALKLDKGVEATLQRTLFQSNSAYSGGAITLMGASMNVSKGCIFKNNQASGTGGAIYAEPYSSFTLSKTNFEGNMAGWDCNNIYYFRVGSTPVCDR